MSLAKKEVLQSLAIGLVGSLLPYLFQGRPGDRMIRVSFVLALVWVVGLLAALIRYRKKGLWFLVGLPFAFYQPFVMFVIAWGCARDFHQCP
jgi:hypothetical protein